MTSESQDTRLTSHPKDDTLHRAVSPIAALGHLVCLDCQNHSRTPFMSLKFCSDYEGVPSPQKFEKPCPKPSYSTVLTPGCMYVLTLRIPCLDVRPSNYHNIDSRTKMFQPLSVSPVFLIPSLFLDFLSICLYL